MKNLIQDEKKLVNLLLLMSVVPLSAALISQYFFGLKPCELCIYQRIPYVVIILFSLIAKFFPTLKSVMITSVVTIHAFLINAGIAFYHVGVEKHWWVNGDCSGNFDMSSPEALKKSLFEAPIVRCDDVQFEFLGVSMAGWNFVYCLAAGIFVIYILKSFFLNLRNKYLNNHE